MNLRKFAGFISWYLGSTLAHELAFRVNWVRFKLGNCLLIFCSEFSSCLNLNAIFLSLFCMNFKLSLSHLGEHIDHVCLTSITEENIWTQGEWTRNCKFITTAQRMFGTTNKLGGTCAYRTYRIWEMCTQSFIGRLKEKRSRGRPRSGRLNNTKKDLK